MLPYQNNPGGPSPCILHLDQPGPLQSDQSPLLVLPDNPQFGEFARRQCHCSTAADVSASIDVQRHYQGRAAFGQSADIGDELQRGTHQPFGARAARRGWLLLFRSVLRRRRILAAKPLRETLFAVHSTARPPQKAGCPAVEPIRAAPQRPRQPDPHRFTACGNTPISASVSMTVSHIRIATGRLSR